MTAGSDMRDTVFRAGNSFGFQPTSYSLTFTQISSLKRIDRTSK